MCSLVSVPASLFAREYMRGRGKSTWASGTPHKDSATLPWYILYVQQVLSRRFENYTTKMGLYIEITMN